jgi:hypothetical protein
MRKGIVLFDNFRRARQMRDHPVAGAVRRGCGRASGHPLRLVRRAERPAGERQRPAVPPRPQPGWSDRLRRRGRDGRGRGERGLASLLQLGFVPAPRESPEPSDGSPGLRVRGQLISPPRGLSRRLVHNGIQLNWLRCLLQFRLLGDFQYIQYN